MDVTLPHKMAGYLRRPAKAGKSLGLRRKRFYKLDGGIFSKYSHENSEASWIINVQGATVFKLSPTHFAIEHTNIDKDASKDFENNRIVLYAKNEDECKLWVECLRHASQRMIQNMYEVGEVIGEGGFAKVRIGRCRRTGELRAIKTMEKEEAHAKLYGREIAIIRRVNHPNIVQTFDIFENENEIHIVMEYMAGGMLYDAIEDGVTFEEADVVQFMREIIDGIIYLHNLGIVHRDLKPENILCTQDQPPFHVKISDFGLSSMSNIAELKEKRLLMSTMIGTPEFIAPEIAKQQPYTEKVDVWALGMLCYNTIAHRLPLDENRDMILQLQKGIKLTFPEKEWGAFGELSKSFMRAVLCPDPEKRLSPFGCLVHPWMDLKNEPRGVPTKVGAHGRFSSMFITPHFTGQEGKECNPRMRERICSVFVPGTWNAKRQWMIAFSAVSAFNRFKWLIHPRSSNENVDGSSLSPGLHRNRRTKGSQLEIDSMTQKISGMSEFSLMDEPSSSTTTMSSPASKRYSTEKQRIWVSAEPADGPRSLFGAMFKGLQKNKEDSRGGTGGISKSRDPEGETVIVEPCSSPVSMFRRGSDLSLKKKVANALNKKASSKLTAPVRKLSKRLMKRSDSKREAGLSPLAAGALDLEVGLANLGITEVDDRDLMRLEQGEASISAGSSSPRFSPNEGGATLSSPCTPIEGHGPSMA